LVVQVIVAEVPLAAGAGFTAVIVGGVVSGDAVVKVAGGSVAIGDVASLFEASVERTRKKYAVPGVSPLSVTECEVTNVASLEVWFSDPDEVP
jgi:hypothetical protein